MGKHESAASVGVARGSHWLRPGRRLLAVTLLLGAAALAGCGGAVVSPEQGGNEDAARVIAAVAEGRARIELVALPPQSPWVSDVVFAEDAAKVRFSTADGHVYALDAVSGAVEIMHRVEGSPTLALVAQTALAVATDAPAPRVYALDAGVELVRFADWAGAEASAIGPNGEYLILGRGNELGVWFLVEQAAAYREGESVQDFLNRQQPRRVVTLPSVASAVGLAPSGNFAVAIDDGATRGTIYAWTAELPNDLEFLGRTNGSVRQLAWSHDEKVVAAVNPDDSLWVMVRGKKGFAPWATPLKARAVAWTQEGLLLVHTPEGTLRALSPLDGSERWSATGVSRCAAAPGRLACTDGKAIVMMQSATGSVLARTVAWGGEHLTLLSDGAHVGTAEPGWVQLTGADGASPLSPATWTALADPQRVGAALAGWGKP